MTAAAATKTAMPAISVRLRVMAGGAGPYELVEHAADRALDHLDHRGGEPRQAP
jgi:hypothetical protein